MNINDYKKAYDGIRATKSLKKRVMDSAEKADEERSHTSSAADKPKRGLMLLPVFGGVAAVAAAFALIIAGGSFLRDLFTEERVIVVTASEIPELTDYAPFAPGKELVGALDSPKLNRSLHVLDVYERMPEYETLLGSERSSPFLASFTAFGDAMIDVVGKDAFTEWKDHFIADPPYYTFYNNPNLLSYVTYFEISEEKIRSILSEAGSFSESEIDAVATRDESLCRRLFVRDELPLLCHGDEGFVFYTMENLYEMPSGELSDILSDLGYTSAEPPEPLQALQAWADSPGNPQISAAVRRKALLVSAALFENSRPTLTQNDSLGEYYEQRVCDFNETLVIDGFEIYNYVLKLVQDSASDDTFYRSAVNGVPSEPTGGTIPSYHRLLELNGLDISPEKLYNALDMINRHYYGQSGTALYTEAELQTIVYGSSEAFADAFLNPHTFRSEDNPVGTLWLTAAEIYSMPVSAWFEYGDLSEEYLLGLYDSLDGMAREFFGQKIRYYREIRLITAAYLDGGALAADEPTKLPTLSEDLQAELSLEKYELGSFDSITLSGAGIYYTPMTELAAMNVSGRLLLDAVHAILGARPDLNIIYSYPLLQKAYLYLWHTDSVNLYNDEYIGTLYDATNYTYKTDGKTLYLGYGLQDIPDFLSSAREGCARFHLERVENLSEYPAENEAPADAAETQFVYEAASDIRQPSFPDQVNPILPNAGERGSVICADFGYDKWLEQPHQGIDFAAASGDEIAVIADGIVTHAGEKNDYGLCVIVDHGNGIESVYAHCSAVYAAEGESVKAGTIVAAVGSTGWSTGPHLHFEIKRDDTPIDPLPYLEGTAEIE